MQNLFNLKEIRQRFPALCEKRSAHAHKGILGTVGVVGGSTGMTGAVALASVAALKTGCGKVFAGFHQNALPFAYLPEQPEIMLNTADELMRRKDISAWVVGCGLGQSLHANRLVAKALLSPKFSTIVLDADGLNLLALWDKENLFRLPENSVRVLTPHPLEAARLLHCSVEKVLQNHTQSALAIAQRYQAWVVLKSDKSTIAYYDGTIIINDSGNPSLATAGSGDVLAGIIGSLLAQKIPVQQAIHGGVWLHGTAGEMLAAQGLSIGATAHEIINQVRLLRHQLTMR
ncbi:MAG: NAD(P)H-hydrate dehydratase [Neisseriaceae bacterium]|nr:NAD(P)H-hydrate dehydratase [Neisseriaceae bacterium]